MNKNTERTAHIVQGCPAPEFAAFEISAPIGYRVYHIVEKPGLKTVSIACQEVTVKNSAG